MKAPDKIYIPFYPNDNGIDTHLGDDWFDSKDIDQYVEGWKEYICKDIVDETIKTAEDHAYFAGQEKFREKLMEWLRYEKEWFEGTDIEPHYQKIIDKLNSI